MFATDPGQDGRAWRAQSMWMPRLSASYKLGDKTVVKAGYGMYYDTLNANDYDLNNPGFSSTTSNSNSTDFGQSFLFGNPYAGVSGISDPFPVRADGTRFDQPTGSSLGLDTIIGSGYTVRTRTTSTGDSRGGVWRSSGRLHGTSPLNSPTTARTRIG